jgi:hypothetical protein
MVASASAFLPNKTFRSSRIEHVESVSLARPMSTGTFSSLIVSTIDADIANIPTNEFAPIFAGGIAVMFGGLFSALAVGFIIDKRNLYANIVADSYAQGADDEEFWKGLSEEEKKKTQELLQRLKESKEGELAVNQLSESNDPVLSSPVRTDDKRIDLEATNDSKEIGMFNDYGND